MAFVSINLVIGKYTHHRNVERMNGQKEKKGQNPKEDICLLYILEDLESASPVAVLVKLWKLAFAACTIKMHGN